MAKNTTILALAGALTALAAAITDEYGNPAATEPVEAPAAESPAKGKRGRPAADKPSEPADDVKTYEELSEIVNPLVIAKRIPEIKAILTRLGAASMHDLAASKQAEFLKDIEALLNDGI